MLYREGLQARPGSLAWSGTEVVRLTATSPLFSLGATELGSFKAPLRASAARPLSHSRPGAHCTPEGFAPTLARPPSPSLPMC